MKVANTVGLVGWRGMVGSVLLQRMSETKDFDLIEPIFFSTSNPGGLAPKFAKNEEKLKDAYDVNQLKVCDIIISCQGGEYTKQVFPKLRERGWKGHWIDAASPLRMEPDATIILDPVNLPLIKQALQKKNTNWIGGNCTVSCMLMGVGALYKANLVEWMSTQTYQAVSGGGTQLIRSLLKDSVDIATAVKDLLNNPKSNILDLDKLVTTCQQNSSFPITEGFEDPTLANSLIPWVDKDLGGVSREEWKGMVETNKILGIGSDSGTTPIPVDGFCVRVATMRCHSQALLFKLKKDVPIEDIEAILAADHEWLRLVPNTREATIRQLTPVAVTGTLSIAVGRIRKMAMGNRYLGAFTIGDQLLWGAAEPLRRMLRILLEY